MARATTRTLLSLDRFSEIIGFDPLHFNQVVSALRPAGSCSDLLYQYNWQDPAVAGREELAQAIADAEHAIAAYVGFSLLPEWQVDERQMAARITMREGFGSGFNVRSMQKSVQVSRGHFIAGGQRAKTLIAATVALAYTDPDTDGYKEQATATTATTVTDINEIAVYFAGKAGADEWEIRPATVAIAGGNVTVTLKRHQLVDPTLWEALAATAVDGDVDANFETHVDIYRVRHDPQQQVQFIWEPENCANCGGAGCTQCEFATQYGCLTARDDRLGFISYRPATWNTDTLVFDSAEWAGCREPDRLRLWYRAGWQDFSRAQPLKQMDAYWERTIAMLALAWLKGDLCDCTAVKTFVNWAREDLALSQSQTDLSRSFTFTRYAEKCPWGTRRGAVEAFQRCNAEGYRNGR